MWRPTHLGFSSSHLPSSYRRAVLPSLSPRPPASSVSPPGSFVMTPSMPHRGNMMDAPAMLFPVSRFKTAWNVGKRLRQLLPRRECTDAHIVMRSGLVQCGDHLRTPPGGEADDVPPELLIEFMLNPRHILMLYANTPLDALKAHTGGGNQGRTQCRNMQVASATSGRNCRR